MPAPDGFVAFARLTERMRLGRHHIVRNETYEYSTDRRIPGDRTSRIVGHVYHVVAWCGYKYREVAALSNTFLVDEKGYDSLSHYICKECEAARTPH